MYSIHPCGHTQLQKKKKKNDALSVGANHSLFKTCVNTHVTTCNSPIWIPAHSPKGKHSAQPHWCSYILHPVLLLLCFTAPLLPLISPSSITMKTAFFVQTTDSSLHFLAMGIRKSFQWRSKVVIWIPCSVCIGDGNLTWGLIQKIE